MDYSLCFLSGKESEMSSVYNKLMLHFSSVQVVLWYLFPIEIEMGIENKEITTSWTHCMNSLPRSHDHITMLGVF